MPDTTPPGPRTRGEAAAKAVRRASRVAVPLALVGLVGVLPTMTIQPVLRWGWIAGGLFGAGAASLFALIILAVWLGPAALVGWLRGVQEEADDPAGARLRQAVEQADTRKFGRATGPASEPGAVQRPLDAVADERTNA